MRHGAMQLSFSLSLSLSLSVFVCDYKIENFYSKKREGILVA